MRKLPFTCQVVPDLSPVTKAHLQPPNPLPYIAYKGWPSPLRSRDRNSMPPNVSIKPSRGQAERLDSPSPGRRGSLLPSGLWLPPLQYRMLTPPRTRLLRDARLALEGVTLAKSCTAISAVSNEDTSRHRSSSGVGCGVWRMKALRKRKAVVWVCMFYSSVFVFFF